MANIMDYLYWRGDLSFETDKFNLVDALIFTQIVYVDFEVGVKKFPALEEVNFEEAVKESITDPKTACKRLGLILPKAIIEMTQKASHTKRYGKITCSNYCNIVNKENACQFAAMCFHYSEDKIFISFRGTDDTLSGWQENLDMVCKFPVPSQDLASRYVNRICELYPKAQIILGGHSKGGNLAIYAGIYCDPKYQSRLKYIINEDGPGFIESNINLECYEPVKTKIINLLPQDSVVGLIFKQFGTREIIVKSKSSGVNQHDAFSWLIKPTNFERAKEVSKKAIKLNESVDKLLSNLTAEEREDLARNYYEFMLETKKDTLTEAQRDWFTVLRKLSKIRGKNRRLLMSIIYDFIRYRQL